MIFTFVVEIEHVDYALFSGWGWHNVCGADNWRDPKEL